MKRLALAPLDTWFFRDSTPFDRGATPQAGVRGTFPPHPPTVAGAIRAELARRNGWDGRGRWSGAIAAVLGDGPDDLGALRIRGPFVLRGDTPVFPLPRHVVGFVRAGAWTPEALLRPGAPVACDLGPRVRLPDVPGGGGRVGDDGTHAERWWVTQAGLARILRGELPAAPELVHEDALWASEVRTGIQRERGTRATAEGALYSTWHARPCAGVRLGVEIDGIPAGWAWPQRALLGLGGESRLAAWETWEAGAAELGLARSPTGARAAVPATRTAVLVALTPLLLDADVAGGRAPVPGLRARIASACTDAPLRIGGWDSGARAPRPLRNALAAGSVLFCDLDEPGALGTAGLVAIGAGTALGFGLCAIGEAPTWEST